MLTGGLGMKLARGFRGLGGACCVASALALATPALAQTGSPTATGGERSAA